MKIVFALVPAIGISMFFSQVSFASDLDTVLNALSNDAKVAIQKAAVIDISARPTVLGRHSDLSQVTCDYDRSELTESNKINSARIELSVPCANLANTTFVSIHGTIVDSVVSTELNSIAASDR
jgi:hypothetical protein